MVITFLSSIGPPVRNVTYRVGLSLLCLYLLSNTPAYAQYLGSPHFSNSAVRLPVVTVAQQPQPAGDEEQFGPELSEPDGLNPELEPDDPTTTSAGPQEGQDVPLGTFPDTPERPSTPDKPVGAGAYKTLFFDNDFFYLEDPATPPRNLIEDLKRIQMLPNTTLEFGGEYRIRLHDEHNMRLDQRDDNFLLQRTRLYTHFRHSDWVRVYVELLDATSSWENLPPRPFDENQLDIVDGFIDLRIWGETDDAELWGRVGRQEMILGSQRLVSNRGWRNVPVFHEGARLMWRAEKTAIDGFWLQPLDRVLHEPKRSNFDNVDHSQQFAGIFSTHETADLATLDMYYLYLGEKDPIVRGRNGELGSFQYNTFGSRWVGELGPLLGEFEGGYQFGRYADVRQSAGFYTLGLGRDWTEQTWTPSFWVYYDWASGNKDPYGSTHGTFYPMFPRGHYYLGWSDVVGRMNIHDLNMRATAKPDPKLTLTLWYHMYRLDQARDALYNAGNVPIRWDPTGAAGRDVGNELDFSITYSPNRQMETLFGYSYLFAGDFLKDTGSGDDVTFLYVQQIIRF